MNVWLARDPHGDTARGWWFVEPELDEYGLEFVPTEPTAGTQKFADIRESVCMRYLGRDLNPGEVVCLTVGELAASTEATTLPRPEWEAQGAAG
jgi:hypothetical protein